MEEPWPPDLPQAHDGFESIELEDALARRAPRRHLLARSALVAGALVVVLGALLRGVLPLPHGSLAAAVPSPTSLQHRAVLQPQGAIGTLWTPGPVNIFSNVSYGVVALNGQQLRGPPPTSVPTLAPGPNTLTLDAAPFPRVTCTIYAIGASAGGGNAYQATSPCTVDGSGDRVNITVYLSGATLPPTAAARALSMLRVAVSQLPTEYADVPAGEYYATGIDAHGAIAYARATQPLAARLDYSADTRAATTSAFAGGVLPGARCAELDCASVSFESPVGQSVWLVSEPVLLTMRFQTIDGLEQGAVTLPSVAPQAFALAYRSDGTWQTVNMGPPNGGWFGPRGQCETGANLLATELTAAQFTLGGMSYGINLGHGTLEGCQISVTIRSGPTDAAFIWRFGVLQAADAAAHALLPALPVAPPSAVQALATPTPATLAP
ncbi:MAG TPA: hypothetical protein VID73_04925 [Ktedonobacterales bacterium]